MRENRKCLKFIILPTRYASLLRRRIKSVPLSSVKAALEKKTFWIKIRK